MPYIKHKHWVRSIKVRLLLGHLIFCNRPPAQDSISKTPTQVFHEALGDPNHRDHHGLMPRTRNSKKTTG